MEPRDPDAYRRFNPYDPPDEPHDFFCGCADCEQDLAELERAMNGGAA